jgi:hypothetical protein
MSRTDDEIQGVIEALARPTRDPERLAALARQRLVLVLKRRRLERWKNRLLSEMCERVERERKGA